MAKLAGKIAVLDFGGQYAHLIANRIRRLGVYSEVLLPDSDAKILKGACGIILSGGPSSVYEPNAPPYNPKIFKLGKPMLGICYGHQLLAKVHGAVVERGKTREYGVAELQVKKSKGIFSGLGKEQTVWMSHGDEIRKMPKGFEIYAGTSDCEAAAVGNAKKKIYGVQFHPEVTHTKQGMKILGNFVFKVCKCRKGWSMKNYVKERIAWIKKTAGSKNVFMLASGGVDSTVALALLAKAIGSKRVYALHVDNGFMRKNESAEVAKALAKHGYSNFHAIDASDRFYGKLHGVVSPEEKRKIIGELFVEIANEEISKLNLDPDSWLLGQGTIYPDTIETGRTKHSAVIKTHHNRVESIREMLEAGRVIEPLNELYKDEVRELGLKLGLPESVVYRHPFPGPGLAIRALCSDGKPHANLQAITKKANEIAAQSGYSAFALPVRSVGVQGDARTYANAVAVWGEFDWRKLEALSTKITNSVREVNRVVYLLTPGSIGSAEPVKAHLTRERVSLLREADAITTSALEKYGVARMLWQCPTILIPVSINNMGESIVLRPVSSEEAMTANFAALEKRIVDEIVEGILALGSIGAVFYDITHKPPATICWE